VASPRFAEVPSRSRPQGALTITDTNTYEGNGRLSSWDTTGFAQANKQIYRDYTYDGSGRLRQLVRTTNGSTRTTSLAYDVDDGLVYERATTAGVTTTTWRYGGCRKDSTGRVTETLLPMLRNDAGALVVVYTEPDGHAMWTVSSGAMPDSHTRCWARSGWT
jgi:YD repeat-containing protein